MTEQPTPEILHKLLRYDPETGNLFWRTRTPDMFQSGKQSAEHNCSIWNARFSGNKALSCPSSKGHLHGHIFGKKAKAHNVIWAMQTGSWPKHLVDHKNVIAGDNRWTNLRAATPSQNQMNQRKKSSNTSGFKGVCWAKRERKWVVNIKANGRSKNLGYFDDPRVAHEAYKLAALKMHGEFARAE